MIIEKSDIISTTAICKITLQNDSDIFALTCTCSSSHDII